MPRPSTRWPIVLGCLALVLLTPAGGAAERCYLLMFGSQVRPNVARLSHTFAVFVKAADGDDPARPIEVTSISWMPRSLHIHTLWPRPEPGVNLQLAQTLDWARTHRQTVALWGPYEIQPELYRRAVARVQLLESGRMSYNVIEASRRPNAVDCIHAVSGVDVDPGLLHTRRAHGELASYLVLHHLCRWVINPCATHDWLLPRLGLCDRGLVRHAWDDKPESLIPVPAPYYTSAPPQTQVVGAPAPMAAPAAGTATSGPAESPASAPE